MLSVKSNNIAKDSYRIYHTTTVISLQAQPSYKSKVFRRAALPGHLMQHMHTCMHTNINSLHKIPVRHSLLIQWNTHPGCLWCPAVPKTCLLSSKLICSISCWPSESSVISARTPCLSLTQNIYISLQGFLGNWRQFWNSARNDRRWVWEITGCSFSVMAWKESEDINTHLQCHSSLSGEFASALVSSVVWGSEETPLLMFSWFLPGRNGTSRRFLLWMVLPSLPSICQCKTDSVLAWKKRGMWMWVTGICKDACEETAGRYCLN